VVVGHRVDAVDHEDAVLVVVDEPLAGVELHVGAAEVLTPGHRADLERADVERLLEVVDGGARELTLVVQSAALRVAEDGGIPPAARVEHDPVRSLVLRLIGRNARHTDRANRGEPCEAEKLQDVSSIHGFLVLSISCPVTRR
jgi:hypothetical protein